MKAYLIKKNNQIIDAVFAANFSQAHLMAQHGNTVFKNMTAFDRNWNLVFTNKINPEQSNDEIAQIIMQEEGQNNDN